MNRKSHDYETNFTAYEHNSELVYYLERKNLLTNLKIPYI